MKKTILIISCSIALVAWSSSAEAQTTKAPASTPAPSKVKMEEPVVAPDPKPDNTVKENKTGTQELKVSEESKAMEAKKEVKFSEAPERKLEQKTLPSQANVSTIPRKDN